MWLLLPFVILPIVEIALFIQVGGLIGVLPTILLVVLSSFAGVAVMRRQGMMAAMDVQRAMQEFRNPAKPMANGALIMVAGLLMIVPGLFTSAVGLLMMIPAVRTVGLRWMGRRARTSGVQYSYRRGAESDFGGDMPSGFGRKTWRDDGTIDAEYSVQDDPPGPVRDGLTDERPGTDQGKNRGNSGWTRH